MLLGISLNLFARDCRVVLTGGGKLDGSKTADLVATLSIPSRLRGNAPNALHNPCRPTVAIDDTVRGRHGDSLLMHPRQREGLKSLEEDYIERIALIG